MYIIYLYRLKTNKKTNIQVYRLKKLCSNNPFGARCMLHCLSFSYFLHSFAINLYATVLTAFDLNLSRIMLNVCFCDLLLLLVIFKVYLCLYVKWFYCCIVLYSIIHHSIECIWGICSFGLFQTMLLWIFLLVHFQSNVLGWNCWAMRYVHVPLFNPNCFPSGWY